MAGFRVAGLSETGWKNPATLRVTRAPTPARGFDPRTRSFNPHHLMPDRSHKLLDADTELCQTDIITAPVPGFGTDAPCEAMSGTPMEFKFSHGGARPGAGRKPKPIAPTQISYAVDELRWFCIRTEYGREIEADMAIRTAGFETFFPLEWKAPIPARKAENGRPLPAQAERIVPLFSRYLFVKFLRSDPAWRRIATLRGVERIFGTTPTNPTSVPEGALDVIRKQCMPNGCIYPPGHGQKPAAMVIGSSGRIPNSAFPDLVGICDWSDGDRVRLLLKILGREVPVTVAQSAVEVVDG